MKRPVVIAMTLVAAGLALISHAQAPAPAGYDLSWHTIDGGGVMRSAGGGFELSGTIGQPDAQFSSGGAYTLAGGFWFAPESAAVTGDCDQDGDVDLADYEQFVACLPDRTRALRPRAVRAQTLNNNSTVDLNDFAAWQSSFSAR